MIGDRLAVTPSVCRLPTEDTPQTLTWDNYKDSPTFSLSKTWTVATRHSLWSELGAVRPSIASSTDPFVIDSDSDLLDGIERLRSDNEPVRKVELVSTDCSSLARSPVFGDSFEVENTSEIVAVSVSEAVAEMNQDKNNELRQQHEDLQDEIDDLDPASVTRETALQLKQELARIWDLKNVYRKGVRQLVSAVPAEDAARLQWEKSCKELVDKVIRHKMQVLASIERVCPTEQMTEYQRKSLELQRV